MARASLDVLMMQELTADATSIDSIRTAIQTGVEAASVKLNDAAKTARIRTRRMI